MPKSVISQYASHDSQQAANQLLLDKASHYLLFDNKLCGYFRGNVQASIVFQNGGLGFSLYCTCSQRWCAHIVATLLHCSKEEIKDCYQDKRQQIQSLSRLELEQILLNQIYSTEKNVYATLTEYCDNTSQICEIPTSPITPVFQDEKLSIDSRITDLENIYNNNDDEEDV